MTRTDLIIAAMLATASASAYCADWTIYIKETPKSPWKKDRQEMRNIEPWPFAIASSCNVTLAGGNHEVKVANKQTGEERIMLCDDVNSTVSQRQRDDAEGRKRTKQQGAVQLW